MNITDVFNSRITSLINRLNYINIEVITIEIKVLRLVIRIEE